MVSDTIVAVSSPPGRGGIGIVRVAGPAAQAIVERLTGHVPTAREASYSKFVDADGEIIDRGISVYYPAPHSYTGDDVVEFQAHGNPLVLQQIMDHACMLGARPARPGEFTERAFRNGKLDLTQAEAVADLIESQSLRAVRSAQRTLNGDFAVAVNAAINGVQLARAALEATIDFVDDVHTHDLLAEQQTTVATLITDLEKILARARQGARLRAGANIVLVGAPNVGKSSLLNCLVASERAIVSDQPGTTRDLVDADIVIHGMALRLIDTAGLRPTEDALEREGINRAHAALACADLAILVTDLPSVGDPMELWQAMAPGTPAPSERIVVHNKIDLYGHPAASEDRTGESHVYVCALTGDGIDLLTQTITNVLGVAEELETEFTARSRHLDGLQRAVRALSAIDNDTLGDSPEIAAEHYREATRALESIGGRYSSEDLLGDIFSRFCIGK